MSAAIDIFTTQLTKRFERRILTVTGKDGSDLINERHENPGHVAGYLEALDYMIRVIEELRPKTP